MIGLQRKTILASTGCFEKRVEADQETSEMSVLGIQQQTKESESSTNLEKRNRFRFCRSSRDLVNFQIMNS